MPLSKRFTWRTSFACSSTPRLRCTTPMPPACAMAIAMRASVTVSIAEDSSGMFIAMSRVTNVRVSAVDGMTLDAAGTRRTSSKVSASRISMGISSGVFVWRFPISWRVRNEKRQSGSGRRRVRLLRQRAARPQLHDLERDRRNDERGEDQHEPRDGPDDLARQDFGGEKQDPGEGREREGEGGPKPREARGGEPAGPEDEQDEEEHRPEREGIAERGNAGQMRRRPDQRGRREMDRLERAQRRGRGAGQKRLETRGPDDQSCGEAVPEDRGGQGLHAERHSGDRRDD